MFSTNDTLKPSLTRHVSYKTAAGGSLYCESVQWVAHPVTVSSRQHLLDEDGRAIRPVGSSSDGDAQATGSCHWDELDDSFTWMTKKKKNGCIIKTAYRTGNMAVFFPSGCSRYDSKKNSKSPPPPKIISLRDHKTALKWLTEHDNCHLKCDS